MPKFKVLITDGLHKKGLEVLRNFTQVDDRSGIGAEELLQAITPYEALIIRGRTKINENLLNQAAYLKVVGRAGVGVDNIDLNAAKSKGITVVNAPTSSTQAVAELTLGLLLSLARPIIEADNSTKSGKWLKNKLIGTELSGKTLGIIGFGNIGRQVARIAAAFDMRMLVFDTRPIKKENQLPYAPAVSFQELLQYSDYISIHAPLNDESVDLINHQALQQMKTGVRIVSTARGGIIDEAALLEALASGKVAGAALDVFSKEPPGNTQLTKHPKVIATPHIGAQTSESQSRVAEDIANEVIHALRGEALKWKVV